MWSIDAFFKVKASGICYIRWRSSHIITAPVTAPQLLPVRPIPPPKPQAIFKANASSRPRPSAYADSSAGAQENPFSNCFFAFSALLICLSSNDMNVTDVYLYHIFTAFAV
jgi:hypothetical protein